MRLRLAIGLAWAGLLVVHCASAWAKTIPVLNNTDHDSGSLRDAIANASPGDTITVPGFTITLASPLVVDKALTIQGAGSSATEVSGNHASRVFDIEGAVSVTISALSISSGNVTQPTGSALGGGVLVHGGNLTLSSSSLTGNEVDASASGGSNAGIAEGAAIAAVPDTSSVTLLDTVVSDNHAVADATGTGNGGFAEGGGVMSQGPLAITGGRVDSNSAETKGPSGIADGGGVVNNGDSATLKNVTVTSNHAKADGSAGHEGESASGGGVWSNGPLTILDSTIGANSATALGGSGAKGGSAQGGGLSNGGDRFDIERSTFSGNTADARGGQGPSNAGQLGGDAAGGGLWASAAHSPASVVSSTFKQNSADGSGGPGGNGGNASGGGASLESNTVPMTMTNATFWHNLATSQGSPSGGGASGGGLNLAPVSTISLTNSTLSDNTAFGDGVFGGDVEFGNAGAQVLNTTVNDGSTPANVNANCGGSPTSLGHNVDSLDECGFHGPGDLVNTDALLGPLQDNGGPVETMGLKPGSASIDSGANAGCPATDARGVLRPAGTACDRGAFEVGSPGATTAAATGVSTTTAALRGIARNPDLGAGAVAFQFGATAAYGSTTATQLIGPTTASAPFAATVGGLAPKTTYHFREVVTNAAGTSSGADTTFTTAALAFAHAPPTLSKLKISPSAVLPEPGRGASIARKRKRGAKVSYTDSEAALTTFIVLRRAKGYRSGKRCGAKPPKHHKRHPRGCTRYAKVGKFTRRDTAGADRFQFSGRVKAKPLRVGRYRLQARARDGGLSSRLLSKAFRIIR